MTDWLLQWFTMSLHILLCKGKMSNYSIWYMAQNKQPIFRIYRQIHSQINIHWHMDIVKHHNMVIHKTNHIEPESNKREEQMNRKHHWNVPKNTQITKTHKLRTSRRISQFKHCKRSCSRILVQTVKQKKRQNTNNYKSTKCNDKEKKVATKLDLLRYTKMV